MAALALPTPAQALPHGQRASWPWVVPLVAALHLGVLWPWLQQQAIVEAAPLPAQASLAVTWVPLAAPPPKEATPSPVPALKPNVQPTVQPTVQPAPTQPAATPTVTAAAATAAPAAPLAPRPTEPSSPAPVATASVSASAPVAVVPPPPAPVLAKPTPPSDTPASFDAAYLDNPRPAYPAVSRQEGEQGTVVLKVHVLPTGLADQVELDKSSGFDRLDKAARSTVARWRFTPARQGERPIAAWVQVPIDFYLKRAQP